MKKILVTGGAGYIGSHTVVELHKAGYEPIIIDDFSNSEKFICDRVNEITGSKIQVIEVDCCDYDLLKSKVSELNGVSGIIHFAAFKAVGESMEKPLEYYGNNLVSLLNLIRISNDFSIKNFVFSSSCTVYGEPKNLPVDETFEVLPAESPYGNTKQIGEEILRDVVKSGNKLKCISLRYFNPIGAHPSALIGELPLGKPNNLVPFITQTAVGKFEKLTVFGNDYPTKDGTNVRDYIHVVDLAKAHVKALEYLDELDTERTIEYFNIGTGNGNSVLEVINAFEKVSGLKLNYDIGKRREGDVTAVYANAEKAEKILAWKAENSLEKSIEDAWKWQLKLKNEQNG